MSTLLKSAYAAVFAAVLAGAPASVAEPAYPALMEMDATLPAHTVYRPADLKAVMGKLPVVAWGNGACLTAGNMYEKLLKELAGHGYLVVAGGAIDPNWPPANRAPGPMVQNKTEQMFETLAWAKAENARKASPYFGRIDTSKVAVMGHSCGGLQAIAAGSDPRVTTAVVLNSGIIRGGIPTPDGGTRAPAGILPASDADLPKIKAPMLYIAGGPTDQAQRGAEGDFEALNVPVFFGTLPVGHGGTWQQPRGGDMAPPVVAWLDWRLKGDAAAARMFTGADCGLCKDARWTVKRKKLG